MLGPKVYWKRFGENPGVADKPEFGLLVSGALGLGNGFHNTLGTVTGPRRQPRKGCSMEEQEGST